MPALSPNDELLYGAFRRAALFELGSDIFAGFESAYFRSFAIPATAKVLCQHEESIKRPAKRATDTGIVIYEIIFNGFESDRSKTMIALLGRVHRGITSSNDDFLYILLSLLIVPYRWAKTHGVRSWNSRETQGAMNFYTELGRQMGVHTIPVSVSSAELWFDAYESVHVSPSPEADRLVAASMSVFRSHLPLLLRPFATVFFAVLINDQRVAAALGAPRVPSAINRLVLSGMAVRRWFKTHNATATTAYFIPGEPRSGTYPSGYKIGEVGPDAL